MVFQFYLLKEPAFSFINFYYCFLNFFFIYFGPDLYDFFLLTLEFFCSFLGCSRYKVEKAMATHSSTLTWKIPWMEEPGRLQSIGSPRIRND